MAFGLAGIPTVNSWLKISGSSGVGVSKTSVRLKAPVTLIDLSRPRYAWDPPPGTVAAYLNHVFSAAALNGEPSLNLTPGRSLRLKLLFRGPYFQLRASPGLNVPSGAQTISGS